MQRKILVTFLSWWFMTNSIMLMPLRKCQLIITHKKDKKWFYNINFSWSIIQKHLKHSFWFSSFELPYINWKKCNPILEYILKMNEGIKLYAKSRDEKYLIIIVTLNDSLVFIRVRVMMTLMPTVPATNMTIFKIK